jgi:hypothetical protein
MDVDWFVEGLTQYLGQGDGPCVTQGIGIQIKVRQGQGSRRRGQGHARQQRRHVGGPVGLVDRQPRERPMRAKRQGKLAHLWLRSPTHA